MPKQKTNRAAAKRLRISGSGKATRGHSNLRHGMIGKRKSRKRRLRGTTLVAAADQARALRLLGKR